MGDKNEKTKNVQQRRENFWPRAYHKGSDLFIKKNLISEVPEFLKKMNKNKKGLLVKVLAFKIPDF